MSEDYMKNYREKSVSWDVLVHSKKNQEDCCTVIQSTLTHREEFCEQLVPHRNDLVVFSTTRDTRQFFFFGVVEQVKEVNVSSSQITFLVWKNYFHQCQINVSYRVEKVSSLHQAMFQFDGLVRFGRSSLLNTILDPKWEDFQLIRVRERVGSSYLNQLQMESVYSIAPAILNTPPSRISRDRKNSRYRLHGGSVDEPATASSSFDL